jgi:methylated-DNA-[protein]-cysteine S-methyltransferase
MNTDIAYAQTDSPIGPVWLAATGAGICTVGLGTGQPEDLLAWLSRHMYFSRIRREFDLPLDARGTAFQKAVWAEVARIPYGATTTYGQIAQRIGRSGAARAVGAAVGANPLSILIPCHRVIGAGGALTGYGGGLEIKAALLRLEGTLPR